MAQTTRAALLTTLALAAGLAAVLSAGCASVERSAPGEAAPAFVLVDRGDYAAAVEAACSVVRAQGFVPTLVDRGAGTIETEPKPSGSLAEPWTWGDHTGGELVEATLSFERRRVRFEFVPTGFAPARGDSAAPLAGPVLPGSGRGTGAAIDELEGELELRVAVSVERQFRPGLQRNTWTRAVGGYARDTTLPDDGRAPRDLSEWTPVARDERLERFLLARVREELAAR